MTLSIETSGGSRLFQQDYFRATPWNREELLIKLVKHQEIEKNHQLRRTIKPKMGRKRFSNYA